MPLEYISYSENLREELHSKYGIYLPNYQVISHPLEIEPPAELISGVDTYLPNVARIGAFSYSWSIITPNVKSVGRYCSIAGNITFGTQEHPLTSLSTSSFIYENEWMWGAFAKRQHKYHRASLGENVSKYIEIGNDVWIGLNVYIKNGVKLGNGCVVGANAVVTKDVPPYAIVAGNPARIIRYRFSDEIIKQLEEIRWWDYAFTDFSHLDLNNVELFISDFKKLQKSKKIEKYKPISIILK